MENHMVFYRFEGQGACVIEGKKEEVQEKFNEGEWEADSDHEYGEDYEIERVEKFKLYDNGGKTIDRYTAIYLDQPYGEPEIFNSLGMSKDPIHGFCQHGAAKDGDHLGKEICFCDLPEICQKILKEDLHRIIK